jgi:outer membrane protein opcA
MRFEATYNKNKIDIYNKEGKKLNGIISKTATVYSDYTYTQSVSESTRLP